MTYCFCWALYWLYATTKYQFGLLGSLYKFQIEIYMYVNFFINASFFCGCMEICKWWKITYLLMFYCKICWQFAAKYEKRSFNFFISNTKIALSKKKHPIFFTHLVPREKSIKKFRRLKGERKSNSSTL